MISASQLLFRLANTASTVNDCLTLISSLVIAVEPADGLVSYHSALSIVVPKYLQWLLRHGFSVTALRKGCLQRDNSQLVF